MKKQEVLDYIQTSTRCKDSVKGGVNKLLAEMLGVAPPAITQYGDVIPVKQAIKLHHIFKDHIKLREYGLSTKGRPKFDVDMYEE